MIRFVNCIQRRADLSVAQFREYWNSPDFVALIERVAEQTGATLYAKNATLIVAANDLVQEMRGSQVPYDGVLEYWWEDTARLGTVTTSAEGRALTEEMLAYQRQFVNLEASTAFFVEG